MNYSDVSNILISKNIKGNSENIVINFVNIKKCIDKLNKKYTKKPITIVGGDFNDDIDESIKIKDMEMENKDIIYNIADNVGLLSLFKDSYEIFDDDDDDDDYDDYEYNSFKCDYEEFDDEEDDEQLKYSLDSMKYIGNDDPIEFKIIKSDDPIEFKIIQSDDPIEFKIIQSDDDIIKFNVTKFQ